MGTVYQSVRPSSSVTPSLLRLSLNDNLILATAWWRVNYLRGLKGRFRTNRAAVASPASATLADTDRLRRLLTTTADRYTLSTYPGRATLLVLAERDGMSDSESENPAMEREPSRPAVQPAIAAGERPTVVPLW